ncbi:MAG: hypothetical protein GY825_01285 [Phycisphaeraceae bacterium]|nr:hypothetical protein [Phycisphaeraceae bacterium]
MAVRHREVGEAELLVLVVDVVVAILPVGEDRREQDHDHRGQAGPEDRDREHRDDREARGHEEDRVPDPGLQVEVAEILFEDLAQDPEVEADHHQHEDRLDEVDQVDGGGGRGEGQHRFFHGVERWPDAGIRRFP